MLEELESEKGLAARVLNAIRHFTRKGGKYTSALEETPSLAEARDLYFASVSKTERGEIKRPWEFRRGFGKKSFRLLEKYLQRTMSISRNYSRALANTD